jgi:hypothetical protein
VVSRRGCEPLVAMVPVLVPLSPASISASNRATCRRASGCIVSMSMMSAKSLLASSPWGRSSVAIGAKQVAEHSSRSPEPDDKERADG